LHGLVGSASDGRAVRAQGEGASDAPEQLGQEIAQALLAQGAGEMIAASGV
ncbi:MAG TPA: hydroxymethylbilane synthase, partial [Lysobacter sp.]|nr:hydroxymethylbilane synthase [Lysobacter sp.]